MVAMALAIEKEGGIDVGYHWSADDFNESLGRILSNHVFFVWGPLYAEQMRQLGDEPDVLLVGGQVYGHLAAERKNVDSGWRDELQEKGCRLIVCAFDNSFDAKSKLTPTIITEFYRTVFSWVQRDTSLGLIVKPKKPDVFDRLPEVGSMLEEARTTGRCVLVDSQVSSYEAALASDLIVGVGVNTAVLDAAVAGIPAAHMDLASLSRHPLYRKGYGKFIFDDAADLFQRMQAWREDPGAVPGFADHSPVMDSIDPFRDGRGAERLGSFLRWFLEELENGKTRDRALLEAARRYGTEVGEAYVQTKTERPVEVG